jgi:hypothetical protein
MKIAAMTIAKEWIKDFIGNGPWNNISQQFHNINVLK